MKLTPTQKRNIRRILPFGGIWLTISWIYLINDLSLSRNENLNPETDITLTVPILIFVNLAILFIGLMVGAIEVIVLEKRFVHFSLFKKIAYKFIFYLILSLLIITITFPIAASIESQIPIYDPYVWNKLLRFFGSLTFVNTLAQLGTHILASVIYASISEHIGPQNLWHLVLGRYHRPKVENRIFMFLDMKDSTSIAEKLGHLRYFELLKTYYNAMSTPIVNTYGEVYQYIGDEVVITWTLKNGLKSNHCVECFWKIKESMLQKGSIFQKEFGFIPDFKAGLHIGEVTSGEISALKREIVYSGDVLNTTARIQALCKEYNEDLLISENLMSQLNSSLLSSKPIGDVKLKGKNRKLKLLAISEALH